MASTDSIVDCDPLATRTDFTAYIHTLFNVTNGNLGLLASCKPQLCAAIWGNGNPDISGIGMLVAYVLEHILGLSAALAFLASLTWQQDGGRRWPSIARRGFKVFHDCATFLTFSIQIAAIVVLVKVDFGISTSDMGDATVRITQAVSALTLLPLTYGTVLLHSSRRATNDSLQGSDAAEASSDFHDREKEDIGSRYPLFVLCWILALYPFYSKLNSVFGSSKIGTTLISTEQFTVIESICFEGVATISLAEDRFMSAFAFLGFIPLSIIVLGRIVLLGMRKHHRESKAYTLLSHALQSSQAVTILRWGPISILGAIPFLACGLLWTIIRMQRLQNAMTAAINGEDADGQWTFGQVIAVTVFAPVLVEACDEFRLRKKKS